MQDPNFNSAIFCFAFSTRLVMNSLEWVDFVCQRSWHGNGTEWRYSLNQSIIASRSLFNARMQLHQGHKQSTDREYEIILFTRSASTKRILLTWSGKSTSRKRILYLEKWKDFMKKWRMEVMGQNGKRTSRKRMLYPRKERQDGNG